MDSAVGLIIHHNSIVIVKRQRREGDPWSGDIAFPGGHVKEGETAVQGVLREIREEVSLSFQSDDIVMELPPYTLNEDARHACIPICHSCSQP